MYCVFRALLRVCDNWRDLKTTPDQTKRQSVPQEAIATDGTTTLNRGNSAPQIDGSCPSCKTGLTNFGHMRLALTRSFTRVEPLSARAPPIHCTVCREDLAVTAWQVVRQTTRREEHGSQVKTPGASDARLMLCQFLKPGAAQLGKIIARMVRRSC